MSVVGAEVLGMRLVESPSESQTSVRACLDTARLDAVLSQQMFDAQEFEAV